MLNKLQHPNIIKVYNSVHTQMFENLIIMEMQVACETIDTYQKRYKRKHKSNVPEEDCAKLMK